MFFFAGRRRRYLGSGLLPVFRCSEVRNAAPPVPRRNLGPSFCGPRRARAPVDAFGPPVAVCTRFRSVVPSDNGVRSGRGNHGETYSPPPRGRWLFPEIRVDLPHCGHALGVWPYVLVVPAQKCVWCPHWLGFLGGKSQSRRRTLDLIWDRDAKLVEFWFLCGLAHRYFWEEDAEILEFRYLCVHAHLCFWLHVIHVLCDRIFLVLSPSVVIVCL